MLTTHKPTNQASRRGHSYLGARGHLQTLEATLASNLLLQFRHTLLITQRVGRILVQGPGEVLVGVVRLEVGVKDTQTLSIVGNLSPVTADVLQVTAEVSERPLEDLTVDRGAHDGLHVNVFFESGCRLREDVVGCTLDSAHELVNLLGIGGQEGIVGNVEDRAEAAAAKLGELVDTQHLNVVTGTVLGCQPLGQFDHLHILQTDAGINITTDDGLGNVHAATDGGVVVRSHAVVLGELVDLNLEYINLSSSNNTVSDTYLSELSDVANLLALQGAEVLGDSAVLEVHYTGERLIKKRANRGDREVTSLGLVRELDVCSRDPKR